MKILFFQRDIFSCAGGGETVYKHIILSMPSVNFFYFIDKEKIDEYRPDNAHPIPLEHSSGEEDSLFYWGLALRKNPNLNDGSYSDKLVALLDRAVSHLSGMGFDLIDIPDFILVGDFIRPLLKKYNVKYKKIVIAAHGRVTSSLRRGWIEQETTNLELLEKNQIKTADAVYGISERYVQSITGSMEMPRFVLDPRRIIHPVKNQYVRCNSKPSLFFIGRKTRDKGPDLFVELSRWIDNTLYNNVSLCGPEVAVMNGSSFARLQEMKKNRGAPIDIQDVLDHKEIANIFLGKSLIVITSREETFNLVALEALFSCCPVAISDGAGVCDYLDRYYPELPYIKIRLNSFYDCIKEIEFALQHYDTYRAQLNESLQRVEYRNIRFSIDKIYEDILALPERTEISCSTHTTSFVATDDCSPVASGPPVSSLSVLVGLLKDWYRMPEHSVAACESKTQVLYTILEYCNVLNLYGEYNHFEQAPYPDLPDFFNGSFFSCSLWHELARLLRISGKEQLAVMFELRAMRNLGRDHYHVLPDVSKSLRLQGFTEEAQVAELMFSQEPAFVKRDSIYTFLQQRSTSFFEAFEREYARVEDARYIAKPKVSIIVSLYNAAPKLRQFLTCLEYQTMVRRHEVEVILEDSCSPADEWDTVRHFLTASPLSIFYGRSPSRETVQCAWNRGIKVARAPYLVLLGADEMLYPDALEKLFEALEHNSRLDWVVANAVQTEVDRHGLLLRDILKNDFHGGSTDICVNDNKYIRWNAAMYRKNLHDKFGFYDSSYNNAGCTEFGYRILPYISVGHIDKTLGVYWDYPEIRVSNPFVNEIAQLRACFVFRTPGGAMYLSQNKSDQEIYEHIGLSLKYRRCVCQHISTDIPYAASLAMLLKQRDSAKHYMPVLEKVLELEAVLRTSLLLPNVISEESLRYTVERAFSSSKEIETYLRKEIGTDVDIKLFNDFLHERFSFIGLDRSGKENISFIT